MIAYFDAPFRAFHLRTAVAGIGGVLSDGYGLGIIGIALSQATPQLGLTPLWTGLLGAASLFGLFLGALLTGPISDRHGRRPIFRWNMAILASFSALQFWADTAALLLLLRLVIGMVLGTDYVVSKALLVEITPERWRGRILGLFSIAWAGGYASAFFVGTALQSGDPQAWRWILLTSALPCAAILPFRINMPESPLWLVAHGQAAHAVEIVRQRFGPGVLPPQVAGIAPLAVHRWRQLWGPLWRRRTLVGCVFFTCQVIPYFAIGTFIAQLLTQLHLQSGLAGGLLYNLSLLTGAALGLLIVDRISRRAFLIGSFLITAFAMGTASAVPQLGTAALIGLFAVFAGVLSAASNLVYVYLPELFPTHLRASGIGMAIAASRIGSAVSTFLLPLVVARFGVRIALGACAVVLLAGAAICQRYAPETRHVPLPGSQNSG